VVKVTDRLARLVRRPARPDASMRTLFEEANVTLESIQDEFDASLRDLHAANWDELSLQLDRVNDLLRSVVEHLPDAEHSLARFGGPGPGTH
jgi:5-bromo-4-chloroindolyl phosphate hydrolysis protein